jgi:tyrosyl-tRNA synthetase
MFAAFGRATRRANAADALRSLKDHTDDPKLDEMIQGVEAGEIEPEHVFRAFGGAAAELGADEFRRAARGELPIAIPTVTIGMSELDGEGAIGLDRLLVRCGFASGTSEARRLIKQGAVSILRPNGDPDAA